MASSWLVLWFWVHHGGVCGWQWRFLIKDLLVDKENESRLGCVFVHMLLCFPSRGKKWIGVRLALVEGVWCSQEHPNIQVTGGEEMA